MQPGRAVLPSWAGISELGSPPPALGPPRFRLGRRAFCRADALVPNGRGLPVRCSHWSAAATPPGSGSGGGGGGPPCVVYCHGAGGSRCDGFGPAMLLLPYGVDVLAFDFTGSGKPGGGGPGRGGPAAAVPSPLPPGARCHLPPFLPVPRAVWLRGGGEHGRRRRRRCYRWGGLAGVRRARGRRRGGQLAPPAVASTERGRTVGALDGRGCGGALRR